jgi:hypothetical protein
LLVRLVRPAGERGGFPDGQVRVEGIELHRAGTAADTWVPLPLVRAEFAPAELEGGQVWLVDVPLPAGDFDQVRVTAAGKSQVSIALRLVAGKWSILSLEVGFQVNPSPPGLRVTLKRAQSEDPY